jgi:predicted dehydrogenase
VPAAVRLGLAGAGAWGRNYIRTIGGLTNVRLACVASRNPQTAKVVPAGCAVVPDWRALLDPAFVDGVIIATPTPTHTAVALAAIDRGLPVLVEKPLTTDVVEARRFQARAGEKQVLVMVEHTQLFHPAYRKLKSLLPQLGGVKALRGMAGRIGPFRADTSVLWDWGSHDVAMCLDLIGMPPSSIAAKVVERASIEGHEGESIEIELGFPCGIAARLLVSNILREKTRRFTALGDRGALTYDDTAADKLRLQQDGSQQAIAVDAELPLTIAVREFAQAITARSRDTRSIDLAVQVVEVLSACASALTSH